MNIQDINRKIEEIKRQRNWDKVQFIYATTELLREFLKNKSLSELDIESIIEPNGIAERIAKEITIKRSQLRKFFNEIKQIKLKLAKLNENDNLPSEIRLKLTSLTFKLAYAVGKKSIDKNFYFFLKEIINNVRKGTKKDFLAFEQIFEAIIAYHTYYNPKED